MAEAFIKLYKKMLKWEWYDDTNTFRLFMHCLLKANWKVGEWHGLTINPGQFVTSLPNLSKETGLSIQQTRTALSHMISTGEITDKAYTKFRVITVNKWSEYQGDNRQLTDNQQTTNTQPNSQSTTIEEYKEIKNKRNNNNTFVKPTVEEVRAYCQERNNGIDAEAFISFYESKGWMIGKNKMKDWKAAVRTWERSRKEEKKNEKPKFDSFTQRDYDFAELERIANGN